MKAQLVRQAMALYELIILKPGGEEVRYTDRPIEVGQHIKIDLRTFVVITQTSTTRNANAIQGFLCTAVDGDSTVTQAPAYGRASRL
jgi:hypothetical protein